jgi:enoyl-CoA hydratase/carnithine racemase
MMECGVINHVVPKEELEAFTHRLAMQIGEASPIVLRILKEKLRVLASLILSRRMRMNASNRCAMRFTTAKIIRRASVRFSKSEGQASTARRKVPDNHLRTRDQMLGTACFPCEWSS